MASSKLNIQLLIYAVEGHKCLYDTTDPNYTRTLIKDQIWAEIADIAGMPREQCKRCWNLLSDRFYVELQNLELPKEKRPAASQDEWPFLQNLMFLKAFNQNRKTTHDHFVPTFVPQTFKSDEKLAGPSTSKQQKDEERITTKKVRFVVDDPKPAIMKKQEFKKPMMQTLSSSSSSSSHPINDDKQFLMNLNRIYMELPEPMKNVARFELLNQLALIKEKWTPPVHKSKLEN